jgi:hypothetical protein
MSQTAIVVQHQEVTQAEWISMAPSVREMAIDMTRSIKEAHDKIAEAKGLAKDAPSIKGGFLGIGRQRKVNEALSKSQVITNEAVYELSELIQQSITFTLRSVKMASDMQKALAYIAVNGIREANGRVETLSSQCTESINTIIEHAQDFIQQQTEMEERQNELQEIVRNNQLMLEERVNKLEAELRDEYRVELLKLKKMLYIIGGSIATVAVAALILSIIQ